MKYSPWYLFQSVECIFKRIKSDKQEIHKITVLTIMKQFFVCVSTK